MTQNEFKLNTDFKNLSLRYLKPTDAESIFNLVQKSKLHLTRNGDYQDLVERDLQATEIAVRHPPEQEESFGVFLKNQFIGSTTLIKYEPAIYGLGYWIGEEFQGQGYITAAVNSLIEYACQQYDVREIWAGIKHSNTSSINLVTRLGFKLDKRQTTHLSYLLCISNC